MPSTLRYAFLLTAAAASTAIGQQRPAPDTTDMFRWFESMTGDPAMAWVHAENAKTLGVLEKNSHLSYLFDQALVVAQANDRIPVANLIGGQPYNVRRDSVHAVTARAARDTLVVAERVVRADTARASQAREPMAIEHPSGVLFVAGYGGQSRQGPPALWQSADHGHTWSHVDVGTEAQGALGNSDVDLAIGPDGTLYYITLVFDATAKPMQGRQISVGVSRDVGKTWTWTTLSKRDFDDRPWIKVGADGVAHAIWNDGRGVYYVQSRDGGRTWSDRRTLAALGGSSHLAIGLHGEVAVRIIPPSAAGNQFAPGVDSVVVSTDNGMHWRTEPAPGHRTWGDHDIPRWEEPLAWDADGVLYSLSSEGTTLRLGRSADAARTWNVSTVVQSADTVIFPYLIARGHGELAATWFSASGLTALGPSTALVAHVALMTITTGRPTIVMGPSMPIDSWTRSTKNPTGPKLADTAGEYIAAIFLRSDGVGVVTTIQDANPSRFGFTWWRFDRRPSAVSDQY